MKQKKMTLKGHFFIQNCINIFYVYNKSFLYWIIFKNEAARNHR